MSEPCPGCLNERQVQVFESEQGYFIGDKCSCPDSEPVRISKGVWSTFNGAEEALESDEYERL